MTEKQDAKRQPYDSSFKALLDDQTIAFLSYFLGEEVIEAYELKESLVKEGTVDPSLRVDCAYRIRSRDYPDEHIGHVEYESAPTRTIDGRLFEYYGSLYRKYRLPIRQCLVCPFSGYRVPTPPLEIKLAQEPMAMVNYRVLECYQQEAQSLLEGERVELYAILPTMKGATFERLMQGLEAMKNYYGLQSRRFSNHYLWFGTFLDRSMMVSEEDKGRIKQKMDELTSLHDFNPWVQEHKARAHEEGLTEGLQKAVITAVKVRFPPLTELAQERVTRLTKPDALVLLLEQVSAAPDENTTQILLRLTAA